MDYSKELTEFLRPYVSEHKKGLIDEVLQKRTRHVTVVVENIFHSHNASAVVRSCDCFGVQDIHVIEGHNEYTINPFVVRGSAKWISINKYPLQENDKSAFKQLKEQGYRLVGTSPNPKYQSIADINIDQKTALVFGTEDKGISDYAISQVDDFVHIPMYGFSDSFNISVSAAICLYELTNKIRTENIDWHLSDYEQDKLRLEWYKKVIDRSDVLEREYLRINSINY